MIITDREAALLAALRVAEDALLAAFPHAPRIPDLLLPAIATVRAAIATAEGR